MKENVNEHNMRCMYTSSCRKVSSSDGFDLEVQSYQWEHQTFQVLNQVVKGPKAFGVSEIKVKQIFLFIIIIPAI